MQAALSVARQALDSGRGPDASLAEGSQRALAGRIEFEVASTAVRTGERDVIRIYLVNEGRRRCG